MNNVFIRIDLKGEWKGSEHRSTAGYDDFREDEHAGASCFKVDDGHGIEKLRQYWTENNLLTKIKDYEDKQVTVFEGEKVGEGPDWEDLAICTRTIAEIDAAPFMTEVFDLYDRYYIDEEFSKDEYYEKLMQLLSERGNAKWQK